MYDYVFFWSQFNCRQFLYYKIELQNTDNNYVEREKETINFWFYWFIAIRWENIFLNRKTWKRKINEEFLQFEFGSKLCAQDRNIGQARKLIISLFQINENPSFDNTNDPYFQ